MSARRASPWVHRPHREMKRFRGNASKRRNPACAGLLVDVDEDGNGVLREGRLYQLVREHDTVRGRRLEITFLEPGAEAYAFTFG